MAKQTFLQGTLILIIAGMITRLLGFVNRIVIARLIGEEGVGLYMMALPSLFLMITLTQIGLPVAISKRVAEANAVGDHKKIKQIVSISFFIIACTSAIFTILMLILAPIIAKFLMTDIRTLYPLIAVTPSISIIAVSSVIKGYFQGMQNMKPQSAAIVIEQVVRIISVYFIIKLLLPYGIEFAAMGAMLGVCIGEIASLFYLLYQFKKQKTVKVRKRFFHEIKRSRETLRQLYSIALPNTGSRIISSISQFIEPILVAQSLRMAGVAPNEATKQYGELTGYAMPLLFLPTFITNSLSIALLPSISELDAKGDRTLVSIRIRQAVRISFASGALATVILTFFSVPILNFMYGTANASKYIVVLAPCFLFLYIQSPLQATLFALDLAKYAMRNSLIGSVVKFVVLFLFASNPNFGIFGVVIAISTSVILITFLHLQVLYKEIGFSLFSTDLTRMALLLVITGTLSYIAKRMVLELLDHPFILIAVFIVLTIVYIFTLLALKMIRKDELKQLPWFNKMF